VPQGKLREGSLIAGEVLRCAQHDKLGKNFHRGVLEHLLEQTVDLIEVFFYGPFSGNGWAVTGQ
jgi:hypothetical protein